MDKSKLKSILSSAISEGAPRFAIIPQGYNLELCQICSNVQEETIYLLFLSKNSQNLTDCCLCRYNLGDIAGCTSIYLRACGLAIPLASGAMGVRLQRALDEAQQLRAARREDDAAWKLRKAFDAVLSEPTVVSSSKSSHAAQENAMSFRVGNMLCSVRNIDVTNKNLKVWRSNCSEVGLLVNTSMTSGTRITRITRLTRMRRGQLALKQKKELDG